MQLTEHFFHNSCLSKHNKGGFSKGRIVGKGVHKPYFLRFLPFLEIQDTPTFHRPIGKTKVLNNSCNQFLYNFYPIYINFGRMFKKVVRCKPDI